MGPFANIDALLDAIFPIVAIAAVILVIRSQRRIKAEADLGMDPGVATLPPTDCKWHPVGRHPNGKTWMYVCSDCEGLGASPDHLPPRLCADFRGEIRRAKGMMRTENPTDSTV